MKSRAMGIGRWAMGFACAASLSWAGEVEDVVGALSVENADKAEAMLAQQVRGLGCDTFRVVEIESVGVIQVPKDDTGRGGWWTARFTSEACGAAMLGNVAFDMRDGVLKMDALVPGETRASPSLEKDVVKSFAMAAAKSLPDCTEPVRIRGTQLLQAPAEPGKPWSEVWYGLACGKDVGQVVSFMPNAKGVGFSMAVQEPGKRL